MMCRTYQLRRKPKVTVVGIGPGSREAMTEEVRRALQEADCLIGAKRMLASGLRPGQVLYDAVAPEKIVE